MGSVNVASYIGKTVTVKFPGMKTASLATNFRIDDTSLTASWRSEGRKHPREKGRHPLGVAPFRSGVPPRRTLGR
ncbi:MAG: hypothetical protein H0U36_10230 [Nocardioidaceae bacterium]|nr:hypothetical protein [Nocardioidaceae bacterium]